MFASPFRIKSLPMRPAFLYPIVFVFALLASQCSNEPTTAAQSEPANEVLEDTLPVAKAPPFDSSAYAFKDGAIELTWEILADVTFADEYNEEVQAYVPYPTFGDKVLAIAGKEVLINGYVIPLEETGDETILVLSGLPFSSCFFCGGAGPESVMDIKLKPGTDKRFVTDERLYFRGKLRLNADDLYYLNYILEDAVPVQ